MTGGGEVLLVQLVFLDLQSLLEDFFSLGSANGAVDSNLFVSADTEGTDSVSGFGENWGLTSKLFKNLNI